ncbi:hypothetical protein K458DRAFT_381660 [Lentithecium fluviatile CBS 122367]|uniref:Uncharacterized protein n=1 Tax=Lentithecium fluviatile CBS 122367 TaxID=1168545 RepID=A0A6G1JNW7_9PLEO|nr:hypothetical protein K458DRAFT_381660 [Lentithecium fluviatile CBS 122367]
MDLLQASQASCMFNLPSLQELIFENLQDAFMNDWEEINTMWECLPGTSAVTNLRFQRSNTFSKTLELAINSCHKLRIFPYDFDRWRWDELPFREVRFYRKLTDALPPLYLLLGLSRPPRTVLLEQYMWKVLPTSVEKLILAISEGAPWIERNITSRMTGLISCGSEYLPRMKPLSLAVKMDGHYHARHALTANGRLPVRLCEMQTTCVERIIAFDYFLAWSLAYSDWFVDESPEQLEFNQGILVEELRQHMCGWGTGSHDRHLPARLEYFIQDM